MSPAGVSGAVGCYLAFYIQKNRKEVNVGIIQFIQQDSDDA